MLKTIIIREIQEYIKSRKFLIGLLITLTLVTITTVINIEDYTKRQQDYLDAKSDMSDDNVFRPPQVLSILAHGKDQTFGNRITYGMMNLRSDASGYMHEYQNIRRQLYGSTKIDFAFLVRVVLSIMTIFLAYNVISEEKTNGTLKQMLSNSVPRYTLIWGKSIGGMLVIILSLIIALIVSVVIMLIHPAVPFGGSELIRTCCISCFSILYLTFFFMLCLFISIVINSPSKALIILLQLWILLIIIYPNASVILAEKMYSLPTEQEISNKTEEISKFYHDEVTKLGKTTEDNWKQRDELFHKNAEAVYKNVRRPYGNSQRRQAELAQRIAMISPAVLFNRIIHRFTYTDLDEYEHFLDGFYVYWQTVTDLNFRYTDKEKPEFSYKSETTLESMNTIKDEVMMLFMYSTIFFTLAYISFLRKDVR